MILTGTVPLIRAPVDPAASAAVRKAGIRKHKKSTAEAVLSVILKRRIFRS